MTHRARRITVVIGALAVALALVLGSSQAAVSSTIRAYFDADGHLMFTFTDGSQVASSIPPGTYQVIYDNLGADDLAVDHAFHLFGPGIDFAPQSSLLHSTFNVSFVANATYTLRDDLHPAIGGRSFVAVAGATSEPTGGGTNSNPTSTTKPVSNDVVGTDVAKKTSTTLRGTLAGAVTTAGKLTLTFKGKTVNSLKAGRYTFVVDDKASKLAFKVQRIKKSAVSVTGVVFVGKKTVTLTLDAGQWWFFSGGPKKTSFVVTN